MAMPMTEQAVRKIIVDGDARLLVEQSRTFGEELAKDGLTTSQIRSVFGAVRLVQSTWERDRTQSNANLRKVLLLKPRLAYQAKREPKLRPLAEVLSSSITFIAEPHDSDEQKRRFGHMVDLFEAVLAYHSAAGGR
jgi:CRISPR-associated protein Csm2